MSHPVTLSFDNGPEPGVTEAVLEILAQRGICATFFVIGRKLIDRSGRMLATRARAEGHRVGNHTFSHNGPLGLAPAKAAALEIGATQAFLGELAPERLFRPVGGGGALGPHLLSPAARDVLVDGRYTCVLWNAVPRDFAEPDAWVQTALHQIATHRVEGTATSMVLHDLPNGAIAHLPAFLDRLAGDDVEIRQDFPAETVIIREGVPTPACAAYVAQPPCTPPPG
jgi:peptidoglycan/xylan/chitin deacetylase (PgdA/CDA1 family)